MQPEPEDAELKIEGVALNSPDVASETGTNLVNLLQTPGWGKSQRPTLNLNVEIFIVPKEILRYNNGTCCMVKSG